MDADLDVRLWVDLVAAVPTARAATLPGVTHMPGMEATDQVNALSLEFAAPLARWS